MSVLPRLLGNRNFILALAIVLGFILGQGAQWTGGLVLPALVLVMTLSMTGVDGSLFRDPRALVAPLSLGFALNYVVQGGLILLLVRLLIREEAIRVGFILLASVPSAVGVIAFTGFLGGDIGFSIVATLGNYLSSLVVTPLALYAFLGFGGSLQVKLVATMAQVIVLPLILSRILVALGASERVARVRGPIINWSFFLIIYTTVAFNSHVFAAQPLTLIPGAVIAVANTYFLGAAIELAGRRLGLDPGRVISMTLLGTSKNAGFAAGIALLLLGSEAAIPSTLQTICMLTYVIYLDVRVRRI